MAKLIDYDNLSRFWEKAKDYIDSRIDSRVGGAIHDSVMIAYHDISDGYVKCSKLDKWPALQDEGQFADGVLVSEGGVNLIVAPDMKSVVWATEDEDQGGKNITDIENALADFDGEADTAAHLEYEACRGEDTVFGYCNAYSRLNANGKGYGAGEWWVPSCGELNIVWTHFESVKYALSLIDGATSMDMNNVWTSLQYTRSSGWRFRTTNGFWGRYRKSSSTGYAVPVTRLRE